MPIAPQLPHRIDLLREIQKLVEPFCAVLEEFPFSKRLKQIDRRSVELLWGFIHTFQDGRYRYHDFHPNEDPHGCGLYFERRQEAAEVTRAAFIAAFGRGEFGSYDEKECQKLVLEVLQPAQKRLRTANENWRH